MINIHATPIAEWHALISEAEQMSAVALEEDLEHYLVSLCYRYMCKSELAKAVLGERFLEGLQSSGHHQKTLLQAVGDECLLFAGLFPDRAYQKRVSVHYFFSVGQTAYHVLSEESRTLMAKLFGDLSTQFARLVEVLRALRQDDLLKTMDLWQLTGSEKAWARLKSVTDAFPVYLEQSQHFH